MRRCRPLKTSVIDAGTSRGTAATAPRRTPPTGTTLLSATGAGKGSGMALALNSIGRTRGPTAAWST
jgi:hypothetical protein